MGHQKMPLGQPLGELQTLIQKNVIEIATDEVNLDLNGFTIFGTGAGIGAGIGIASSSEGIGNRIIGEY